MSESEILRINSGTINTVNDVLIGQTGASNGGPSRSHFTGQLGKWADLDSNNIVYDASVGTVRGGRFQYVRLASGSAQPVRGQLLFWDNTVALNLFQVSATENVSSTSHSTLIAGVVLNPNWTPGYYGIIQILGTVAVKFRGTLTTAGAIGCPVYAATAAGADEGLADVLTTDATAVINATYLGKAVGQPIGGAVSEIDIVPQFRRF